LSLDLKAAVASGASRAAIRRLQDRLSPTVVSDALIAAIQETYSSYRAAVSRLENLESAIHARVKTSDWQYLYDRWMTIPLASSVGCAALIVASKGKADKLDFKVFKATVGAYPQVKESGKIKKSRAAKRGYRPAMKALHMWAQALVRDDAPDTVIKRYFAGGEKNGGRKFSATKARLVRVLHGVARSPNGYQADRVTSL
jgi:hypothetical protein